MNSTHADFELLRKAATATGSDAREFDGLNHIYMPVEGAPTAADVLNAGTVSAEFMDYLAAWLRKPVSHAVSAGVVRPD